MVNEAILQLLNQPLWVFTTTLARISPVLMLAPLLTSSGVPMRIRAILAVAIAALLTPVVWANATSMPGDLMHLVIGLVGEFLIGFLLGSVMLMTTLSLQLAGQSIGHLAGFEIATAIDPSTNEDMPVLTSLFGMLAAAIFLLIGGHREILDCAIDSFTRYPAGGVYFETHWLDELQAVFSHSFDVGIRAAAPMAIALLLSNVVTSLLARTLPQLNVLSVGFNINIGSLMLFLLLSISSVAWVYQSELAEWINCCRRIVQSDG